MIVKYSGSVVPMATDAMELDAAGDKTINRYAEQMDQHLLHNGAQAVWDLVADANSFRYSINTLSLNAMLRRTARPNCRARSPVNMET